MGFWLFSKLSYEPPKLSLALFNEELLVPFSLLFPTSWLFLHLLMVPLGYYWLQFSFHLMPRPGIELTAAELQLREGPFMVTLPTELHGRGKFSINLNMTLYCPTSNRDANISHESDDLKEPEVQAFKL